MTYNVRNIAIALVLAGIAAFLVIMYTGNVQKQAKSSQQTTSVLVASQDIPAGTSVADAISGGQLQPRQVVQQDVIVGALTDEKALDSSYVTKNDLVAGQQVTASMFAASSDTRVTAQLKANYRAIEIPLTPEQVLGGTLEAGDHVDLVGTYTVHPSNGDADYDISRVIVRDVLVLKAPQTDATTGKLAAGAGDNPSVMLEVPDTVAPKITFTKHAGDDALWLILRPGNGSQDGPISLATVKTVIFEGLNTRQIAQAFFSTGSGR
jgi:pilus assembly protein CpaB